MITDKLFYLFLISLRFLLSKLPRGMTLAFGRNLGRIAYHVFAKRRAIAAHNIQLALGDSYSATEQQCILKNCFINLGLNFAEFMRLSEITKNNLENFVSFSGWEHVENALAKKQGVLTLNAHVGNWELLAGVMTLKGLKTAIVVKRARQKGVNDFISEQRQASGLKLFSGRQMVKDILRFLHQGGFVGIVLDQSAIRRDGIEVPFFGHTASTLKSLAILSLRTKVDVIPMYIYRQKNKHHVVILPPIAHQDDGVMNDENIYTRTVLYTKSIEDAIRTHPEQWMWTHNRWKRRKS